MQYQIFWKDNDRPVDEYEAISYDYLVDGFIQLHSYDETWRRLINLDEVRLIVIKDAS